jgi:hypothetical protein
MHSKRRSWQDRIMNRKLAASGVERVDDIITSPKMMIASLSLPPCFRGCETKTPYFLQSSAAMEPMLQDRQQMSATPFYRAALWPLLAVPSIATTDKRAQ